MDIQADRRHATTANTALTHISSFNTEQLGLYWPSYCSSLTVVVCLGVNSGPYWSGIERFCVACRKGLRPSGPFYICNTKPLNSTTVKGPEFTEAYHGSPLCCPLPSAATAVQHCQFLMRFVDVLQSSYCLVSVVG